MRFREIFTSIIPAAIVSAGTALAISPPFPTPWTSGYESIPADTEQESQGASRIRDLKLQLRERLAQDHSWAGDGNDGYHNQVTLLTQTANPIPAFDNGKTGGVLFSELVNSEAELIYADNNGHTTQLTSQGSLTQNIPAGSVFYFAGSTTPSGYLLGNGNAVSRTTFSNLFANVGTTYGNGDGTTTFNLPDCRARYVAGGDATNATGRLTGLSGGVSAANLGNVGGSQQFTIAAANLPALPITITDPGHFHTIPWVNAGSIGGSGTAPIAGTTNSGTSTTGITAAINSVGANNPVTSGLPPSIIFNCIIKTENDQTSPIPDTYAENYQGNFNRPERSLPSPDRLLERYSIIPPEARLYS